MRAVPPVQPLGWLDTNAHGLRLHCPVITLSRRRRGLWPKSRGTVAEDLTPLDLASPGSRVESYHIVQLLLNRVVDVSVENVICNSLLFLPS